MSWRFISLMLGYVMVVLVFSGAIAFTFTSLMDDTLFGTKRVFFCVMLFAYGVYRCFRLYQAHQQIKHEK